MLIIKNHAVFACAAVALLSFAVMVESVAFFIDDSQFGKYKLSESAAYSFQQKHLSYNSCDYVPITYKKYEKSASFYTLTSATSQVLPAISFDNPSAESCNSQMQWPVKRVKVVKEFNPPPKPWMAGHRGVDLSASQGTLLYAPADGVISFSGFVAGKSVVSIRHGKLTSTFEPAVTDLTVGTAVRRGQLFGRVEGGSDHCGKTCVQWGLKSGKKSYVNPQAVTKKRRIVFKPID